MGKGKLQGSFEMFSSAALFSIMAVLVKLVSENISAPEIIFFRSFISVVIIVALGFAGKVSFRMRSKEKLIFRGIVGGLSLMLYFYSISLTTLSNAVLLSYTYPIFASIFSVMYLKEQLTPQKLLFIFSSFIGLALILQFDFHALNIGDLLALISGITSGMAIVSIRELRKTDSSAMIVFFFVLFGTIFSLFFIKGNATVPQAFDLSVLIFIGVIGTFGQLLMTRAYKLCSTALGGVIAMSSVPITAILSVLIFKDSITLPMVIGGFFIFVSATFFSLSEEYELAK